MESSTKNLHSETLPRQNQTSSSGDINLSSNDLALTQILDRLDNLSKKIDELSQEEVKDITAEIRVATRMPDELLVQIKNILDKNTGQDVELVQVIDPNIIGGLVLTIGDERHDISIKSQLERLKKEVTNLPWASLIQGGNKDE